MLKTNSKEVRNAIREYILYRSREGLEGYLPNPKCGYDGMVTKCEIDNAPMQAAERIFNEEYGHEIARSGRAKAWISWQCGLRGACPVYNGCYEASRRMLQCWLQETDEESARYSDDKVDELILNLLWREYDWLVANGK